MPGRRQSRRAHLESTVVPLGCGLLLVLVIVGLVVGLLNSRDDEVADVPPPYEAQSVIELNSPPDGFEPDAKPAGHWLNAPEDGSDSVESDIVSDFYPRLGDPQADIRVNCRDKSLADYSKFHCLVRTSNAADPHRNVEATYDVAMGHSQAGSYEGQQVQTFTIEARKIPLVRAQVLQELWETHERLKNHKEMRLACDRMPAVMMVEPGATTQHHCYVKHVTDKAIWWTTYAVRAPDADDPFRKPVLADVR